MLSAALAALVLITVSCSPDPVEGQNPGECVDGADNDEFGTSVSLSGDLLAVGAAYAKSRF